MATFTKRSTLPISAQALFDWHSRQGAFQRLVTPWQKLSLLEQSGTIHDGDFLKFAIHLGPLRLKWHALHDGFNGGKSFIDIQKAGPFSWWRHHHRFHEGSEDRCEMEDHIDYGFPLHSIAQPIAGPAFRRELDRMFQFRHQRVLMDIRAHQKFKSRPRLRIAVTGASGLLGQALCAFLSTGGHQVYRLVRHPADKHKNEIHWSITDQIIDHQALEGLDGVIHLAGESIGNRRWSPAQKARLLQSRIAGTQFLSKSLAALNTPPKTLISASAIGYYGDQGDALLTEDSPVGDLFLSEICEAWEKAAAPAVDAGIRVVHPRLGVVLSGAGGALQKMSLPFLCGLGGRIGSGKQYMSWISLDDAIMAIVHLLYHEDAQGPVNLVAPQALKQAEFAQQLAKTLSRPHFMPLPEKMVHFLMGEMGRELLLTSQRVEARALDNLGYQFTFPTLIQCLRFELGRFQQADHPPPEHGF